MVPDFDVQNPRAVRIQGDGQEHAKWQFLVLPPIKKCRDRMLLCVPSVLLCHLFGDTESLHTCNEPAAQRLLMGGRHMHDVGRRANRTTDKTVPLTSTLAELYPTSCGMNLTAFVERTLITGLSPGKGGEATALSARPQQQVNGS